MAAPGTPLFAAAADADPEQVVGAVSTATKAAGKLIGKKAKKKRKEASVLLCVSNCKYSVVREAAKGLGWCTTENSAKDWDVFWMDWSVNPERVCGLRDGQRLNHFPGMSQICRKGDLSRNVARMVKGGFAKEYAMVPPTFVLPEALTAFKVICRAAVSLRFYLPVTRPSSCAPLAARCV